MGGGVVEDEADVGFCFGGGGVGGACPDFGDQSRSEEGHIFQLEGM